MSVGRINNCIIIDRLLILVMGDNLCCCCNAGALQIKLFLPCLELETYALSNLSNSRETTASVVI